jgi:hypothetical protein
MGRGMLSSMATDTRESRQGEKVRENLLRRMADRQGLALVKSRRRDPRALDYGRYRLVRGRSTVLDTKALDDVEAYLTGDDA